MDGGLAQLPIDFPRLSRLGRSALAAEGGAARRRRPGSPKLRGGTFPSLQPAANPARAASRPIYSAGECSAQLASAPTSRQVLHSAGQCFARLANARPPPANCQPGWPMARPERRADRPANERQALLAATASLSRQPTAAGCYVNDLRPEPHLRHCVGRRSLARACRGAACATAKRRSPAITATTCAVHTSETPAINTRTLERPIGAAAPALRRYGGARCLATHPSRTFSRASGRRASRSQARVLRRRVGSAGVRARRFT